MEDVRLLFIAQNRIYNPDFKLIFQDDIADLGGGMFKNQIVTSTIIDGSLMTGVYYVWELYPRTVEEFCRIVEYTENPRSGYSIGVMSRINSARPGEMYSSPSYYSIEDDDG